jgi:hypothetical protein
MTYMASVVLRPVRMGKNVYRSACAAVPPAGPDGAAGSATKNASEFVGIVTSQFLPRFCFFAISSARSMLSACTATLKGRYQWTQRVSIERIVTTVCMIISTE